MSMFTTILNKLGIGGSGSARPPSPPETSTPAAPPRTTAPQSTPTAPSPQPSAPVDVAAVLEQKAAANPQKLNWRTSIVDLLKLLDMESSLTARKQLATELGCPPELMNDSARMNMWLHKTVLARVEANGGRVPQELLH
jgi:hypothetical protein